MRPVASTCAAMLAAKITQSVLVWQVSTFVDLYVTDARFLKAALDCVVWD